MRDRIIFSILALNLGLLADSAKADSLEQLEYGLAEAPSDESASPTAELPIQPLPAPSPLPLPAPMPVENAAPLQGATPNEATDSPASSTAQPETPAQPERKESFVVQPPASPTSAKFEKKFEFQLGTSFLPYDALYQPLLLEASLQWEFKKDWLWEIGRFGWAITKLSSGLKDQVQNDLQRELAGVPGIDPKGIKVFEGNEMKKLRFVAGGSMGYRLLDGELTAFRKKKIHHEWIFNLGGTYFNMRNKHQVGPTLGAQVRFKFNDHFNAQIRADQTIGVMMKRQNSIGIFGIGLGYRF